MVFYRLLGPNCNKAVNKILFVRNNGNFIIRTWPTKLINRAGEALINKLSPKRVQGNREVQGFY